MHLRQYSVPCDDTWVRVMLAPVTVLVLLGALGWRYHSNHRTTPTTKATS